MSDPLQRVGHKTGSAASLAGASVVRRPVPASCPAALLRCGRLQRVRVFVELRMAEEITLESAAIVAGLERTYFSKFFHRQTGVRFTDWLAAQRVDRAKVLMRRSDLALEEIAARVGFGSLRTLERRFRHFCGCTPSGFRAHGIPCQAPSVRPTDTSPVS